MRSLPSTQRKRPPEDRSSSWAIALLAMVLILGISPGLSLSLPFLVVFALVLYFGLHFWRSWRFRKTRAFHSVFLGKGEFRPVGGSRWIYHLGLARMEVDLTEAFKERASLSTEIVALLGDISIRVPPGTRVACRLRGLAADLSLPPTDGRGGLELNLDIRTLFGVIRVEET